MQFTCIGLIAVPLGDVVDLEVGVGVAELCVVVVAVVEIDQGIGGVLNVVVDVGRTLGRHALAFQSLRSANGSSPE